MGKLTKHTWVLAQWNMPIEKVYQTQTMCWPIMWSQYKCGLGISVCQIRCIHCKSHAPHFEDMSIKKGYVCADSGCEESLHFPLKFCEPKPALEIVLSFKIWGKHSSAIPRERQLCLVSSPLHCIYFSGEQWRKPVFIRHAVPPSVRSTSQSDHP